MHSNYLDIRERITEEPVWYDENGCPRYGKFSPELCPNIYANTVVFLRIECQNCAERFDVQMHSGLLAFLDPSNRQPKNWHYGDPPRHDDHGQRCAGETMNCADLEVLEVWHRAGVGDWKRYHKLEGKIK